MTVCARCDQHFLPATTCPHCGAAPRPGLTRAAALLSLVLVAGCPPSSGSTNVDYGTSPITESDSPTCDTSEDTGCE